MIGKNLAHYRILEKLGSGGMGDVYVAEDSKLERRVALKLLPPEMAENDERRSRFEREAKAVAALSHPNIVTVYSIEEADGVHFMTMELVPGRPLSEAIPKGGLPLGTLIDVGISLAEAIAAAHEQGVTHRDVKPANIIITDDGRVKILDFGLAKLRQEIVSGGSSSELETEHLTAEGKILGTVHYMSPEQTQGKNVDHRSDIFSAGVVLYEMATGAKPFTGDSPATIISSINKDTPQSVTELSDAAPRELGKILRRCLAKDPERRFQSAKDLRNELEELKGEVESGELLEGVPVRTRKRAPVAALVTAAVVVSAIATYLLVGRGRDVTEGTSAPTVSGFSQLTSDPGIENFPSLSPDGRTVAYTRDDDIYVRRVGGERVLNLTEDSPAPDSQPDFSPDGEQIVFRSGRDGGGIFVMGATGESVRRLTDFGFNPTWSPDGKTIYFGTETAASPYGRTTTNAELWTVDVASGQTELLFEGDAVQPRASPNGTRIAYWALQGGQRDIWTLPAEGGEPVPVTQDIAVDGSPIWAPDGKHLYFSSDRGGSLNLWRVPIDESTGEVRGEPEPLTTPSEFALFLSFAGDGTRAVYASAVQNSNVQRVRFDASSGRVLPPPESVTQGSSRVIWPDVSPDGEWVAFSSWASQEDIFVMRGDGSRRRQLTDDLHRDRGARWSPDGETIAFYSDRSGSYEIWRVRPDGSDLTQLTDEPEDNFGYPVWSPDGTRMSSYSLNSGTSFIFDPNQPWGDQSPEPLAPWESEQGIAVWSWSPDGGSLAGWLHGGERGIFLYSMEEQEYTKLNNAGARPAWRPDGGHIVFQNDGDLFIIDSQTREMQDPFDLPGFTINPAPSTDGAWLYYTLFETESDIWLLELD